MSQPSPRLEIINDTAVSIDDLVRMQAEGFSVLRSAHVGNLSPYNLTIADASIPILSVDHTITGVDTNYFPEQELSRVQSAVIAPLGTLVCRTVSDDGRYLDERHIDAVRGAVPSADVYTNTEYLRRNEAVAGEIVNMAVREFPGVFTRLALADGTTRKDASAASRVADLGILQLTDEPRAERTTVLMPNSLDILANFVIEALRTERAVQYHLSGPDMVRYIGGLMPQLQAMYGRLVASSSFGAKLPPALEVRLVPTAPARFATTMDRRELLDSVITAYDDSQDELAALNAQRKAFFAGESARDDAARKRFLDDVRAVQTSVERQLGERTEDIPELFIDPGQSGFITQYDVAREGGLYVPEANRVRPMAVLATMVKTMQRARRSLRL